MCLLTIDSCGRQHSKSKTLVRRGIIYSSGCTENCMKLQINAAGKNDLNIQDAAIVIAYENKFIIPLDL